MLNRAFVLVVEDEPYIALDVAFAIEDADGQVAGPAASAAEALALISGGPVDAAILDVNLGDEDISPVVAKLTELGIPMILQTGIGLPPHLATRFSGLTVHVKPCDPNRLVAQIAEMLDDVRAETPRSAAKRL